MPRSNSRSKFLVRIVAAIFRRVTHDCPRCGARQKGQSNPRGLRDYCWDCLVEMSDQ